MSFQKKVAIFIVALICSIPVLSFGQEPNQTPVVDAGPDQFVVFGDSPTLNGSFRDDDLPIGSTPTITWCVIGSSPTNTSTSTVFFSNPGVLNPEVVFTEPGIFILQLKVDDGELTGTDEVIITVHRSTPPPVNQAPIVDAGPDQFVVVGDSVTLSGTVKDDGLPVGSTLTVTWCVVGSSPTGTSTGTVIISDPFSLDTTAVFTNPGTFILKLKADDGELMGMDEVIISVISSTHPAANQPPVVDAGEDQITRFGKRVRLKGKAKDDGLPNPPGKLTFQWSAESSTPTVTSSPTFTNPNALETFVHFPKPGLYVIRLTVSDGALEGFDQVQVRVMAPIQGPLVLRPAMDGQIESGSNNRISGNTPARIIYGLTRSGDSDLRVFDRNGRLVKEVNLGFKEAGFHTLEINGNGPQGQLGSGVYWGYLRLAGQLIRKFNLLVVN